MNIFIKTCKKQIILIQPAFKNKLFMGLSNRNFFFFFIQLFINLKRDKAKVFNPVHTLALSLIFCLSCVYRLFQPLPPLRKPRKSTCRGQTPLRTSFRILREWWSRSLPPRRRRNHLFCFRDPYFFWRPWTYECCSKRSVYPNTSHCGNSIARKCTSNGWPRLAIHRA